MTSRPNPLKLALVTALPSPRDRVFRALTEASALAKWWGPLGFTLPEVELDVRVGGHYRFGMKPADGELFHLSGEFLEVDPPSYLAYTFRYEEPDPDDRETVVRLTLTEVGETTELALSQGDFATEARLSLHQNGWMDSFNRLHEYVGSGG